MLRSFNIFIDTFYSGTPIVNQNDRGAALFEKFVVSLVSIGLHAAPDDSSLKTGNEASRFSVFQSVFTSPKYQTKEACIVKRDRISHPSTLIHKVIKRTAQSVSFVQFITISPQCEHHSAQRSVLSPFELTPATTVYRGTSFGNSRVMCRQANTGGPTVAGHQRRISGQCSGSECCHHI